MKCVCLVSLLCLTLCDPIVCSPSGSSVHGDSPGKNTGVGCHAILQEIFPTQELNPGLPRCRQIFLLSEPPANPKNTRVGHKWYQTVFVFLFLTCFMLYDNLGFGTSWCKLLYIEGINNKVPLYSTGKYLQYPVINHNGKE